MVYQAERPNPSAESKPNEAGSFWRGGIMEQYGVFAALTVTAEAERTSFAPTLCTLKTEQRGTSEARLLSLRFIEPMKVKPSGY